MKGEEDRDPGVAIEGGGQAQKIPVREKDHREETTENRDRQVETIRAEEDDRDHWRF